MWLKDMEQAFNMNAIMNVSPNLHDVEKVLSSLFFFAFTILMNGREEDRL